MKEIVSKTRRILLPTLNTLEIVWTHDILYLQGMENYSKIRLSNGEIFISTQSLGQLFSALNSYGFYQCHKSYVVNLNQILRYYKEGQAELVPGEKVPVARRRKEEFISALKKINNL